MTDHVRLCAGSTASGSIGYEVLPARRSAGDEWVITGTPALVQGIASGDTIRVTSDGEFSVVHRAGNLGIVSYAEKQWDLTAAVTELRTALAERGLVDVDPQGRWCVATIPVSVGFAWIENVFNDWSERTGAPWSYVNVYGEGDRPLNWWL